MDEVVEKKGVFSELKKDKLLLSLVIIILVLGVYVRFSHYNEEGLWSDDSAFVPAGLLFFNPHSYYPGLSVGNFPLGYFFIGAGCMLSGEDFSRVSEVRPLFYPDRPMLIGDALTKGEKYCHMPMYFFGLLFFFLIAFLAFLMLDKYSATFVTAFFAFYPQVLLFSRWIRTDIVFWVFLTASLIFLWLGYNAEKASRKELIFFAFSFSFFGLAQAAKETTVTFVVFGIVMFFSKYFAEVLHYLKSMLKSLELKIFERYADAQLNLRSFRKNMLFSIIGFLFFFLLPFNFSPKNVYDTYRMYQMYNSEMSAIKFSLAGLFNYFYNFFLSINFIDTILFLFAFVLLIALFFKKHKTKLDKFLLYFNVLGILVSLFFHILDIHRLATPFLFFFVFLMGLSISDKWISIPKLLRVNQRTFFFIFMIIYVVVSFIIVISTSPYFAGINDVYCFFEKEKCVAMESSEISGLSSKVVYNYIQPKLGDKETFYGPSEIIHFYIKHSQHMTNYQFESYVQKEAGRSPTLSEWTEYYNPNNETIRYLFINPYQDLFGAEGKEFVSKYQPNDTIRVQDLDIFYVYDLKDLKEK